VLGFFAAVKVAARRDAALDDGEDVVQKRGIGQGTGDGEGVLTNGVGRFQEISVRERPAIHEEEPMLDDHGEQFGEDLAQDAPGVGTARLIDVAVAFPELKEEFDVPAGAQQDEGFTQGEQDGRHAGDQDGPVAPRALGGAGRFPAALGLGAQASATRVGHLRRHAGGAQTARRRAGRRWSTLRVTVRSTGWGALRGEQIQHVPARPVLRVDGGPRCQTREPIHALCRHSGEHPQREEAQITDAQRSGRQRVGLHRGAAVGGAAIVHERSAELPPTQIVAHMEFERGRPRATAQPPQGQGRRQGDRRGSRSTTAVKRSRSGIATGSAAMTVCTAAASMSSRKTAAASVKR